MIARRLLATLLSVGLLLAAAGQPVAAGDTSVGRAPPVPAKKTPKKKSKRTIRVRKIRPRSGRTFVKLDTTVRIRFSRPVDPASITPQTVQFRRLLGDDVSHAVSLEKGDKVLVLTPTGGFLDPGKDYEVVVRFGVASIRGRALRREARAIFFTDSTVPPFQFLRPEQFEQLESHMIEGRAGHTATLLDGGDVLIAGGLVDAAAVTGTAEVFSPGTEEFHAITSSRLRVARAYHEAVTISSGAMILGGWNGTGAESATEVYDPLRREIRPGPPLIEERDFTAAVALEDGRVLVVGGLRYTGASARFSDTAEIYDPSLGAFRETRGSPIDRRAGHRLTLLDDGRVLVTGGLPQGGPTLATAEIFDPRTETFTRTSSPSIGFRQLHTATKLSSGAVLLADGGNAKLELYDPTTDRFFEAGGASFARRTRATASLLPGDRVLIIGGFDQRGDETLILESMDLYLPNLGGGLGRVVRPDVLLQEPRAGHTATTLGDSRVLVTGGFGQSGDENLSSAFLFDPN